MGCNALACVGGAGSGSRWSVPFHLAQPDRPVAEVDGVAVAALKPYKSARAARSFDSRAINAPSSMSQTDSVSRIEATADTLIKRVLEQLLQARKFG